MKEIALTQGKVAIVDDEDFERLNQWKWCFNNGYAVRSQHVPSVNGKRKMKVILMHREILKTPDSMDTDHRDGNRLNNCKTNLRICTTQENIRNKGLTPKTSSKYKGVTWYKRDNKWMAYIMINGVNHNLGYFPSESDAATAYNMAALRNFREYAKLNMVA